MGESLLQLFLSHLFPQNLEQESEEKVLKVLNPGVVDLSTV